MLYKEAYFNHQRSLEQYTVLDRQNIQVQGMTVEIGDLYDPTKNELVFVKIGTPQKLGYVIDQSLNTLKIFQTGTTSQPTLNGVEVKPKKLCLWIVLQRSKTLNKISEIKSLIFLMKLNEWQKSCRNAGFESVLRVSYIQNNA